MKKKIRLFFLFIIPFHVNAQDFESIKLYSYPDDIFVVNDSTLLIFEKANRSESLYLYSMVSGKTKNFLQIGRGPGEFSGNGTHILINYENNEIIMWDYGLQRLSKYSLELDYVKDFNDSEYFSGSLASFPVEGKFQLFLRMSEDSFAEIVDIESDSIITVINNNNEILVPLKSNFLLKQGTYTFGNNGESIIFASKYSSVIAKITKTGLNYITLGKPDIPFPLRDKNDEYGIPSLHEYTSSTMDISVFDNKIYVLHSGKKTSYREAFWHLIRGKIMELQENLNLAQRLFIYDFNDGELIREIELPFEVRKAKVFKDTIYTLSDAEEDAKITIIPISSL